VIKAISLMAVKMTELMEAEGRLAKSEIHQLVKALMLYMVSGSLIVLGIMAMAAGFYSLMQQVMPPGAALLVGAILLITIAAGFANYAQRIS
tara:strand:+ start:14 stop:289 length:276 start_codon:yes stop_codon:yes gene_type:complete